MTQWSCSVWFSENALWVLAPVNFPLCFPYFVRCFSHEIYCARRACKRGKKKRRWPGFHARLLLQEPTHPCFVGGSARFYLASYVVGDRRNPIFLAPLAMVSLAVEHADLVYGVGAIPFGTGTHSRASRQILFHLALACLDANVKVEHGQRQFDVPG